MSLKMKNSWLACSVIFLLISSLTNAFAQKKDSDDEFDYQTEFDYGINFNTNAGLIGGGYLKYSKQGKKKNVYRCYALEIVKVKHPKEIRYVSRATGNSYIYNKINYLFVVRPQYGREYILFRKAPEQGVHLNAIVAGGLSLGLTKPYYILWSENPNNVNNTVSVPYDPNLYSDQSKIQGTGSFTDGFNQIQVKTGAHLKTGLSFEFGRFNNSVIGIEAGVLAEVFPKDIVIMPSQNKNVFTSAYLTWYYGIKHNE